MAVVKSINICFFGVNRSLSRSIESINKYLFNYLDDHSYEYSVFGAFNKIDSFSNSRSGEYGLSLEQTEDQLIHFDGIKHLDQDLIDDSIPWNHVFRYGDTYEQISIDANLAQKNSTTKNIFRSLLCLKSSYDLVPGEYLDRPTIFIRPDIDILSSIDLDFYLSLLSRKPKNYSFGQSDGVAVLPGWHSWDGLNDRFAICSPGNAAFAYANRIDNALSYLDISRHPMHPESYLLHVLNASRVAILPIISTRMARIRANGIPESEEFNSGHRTYDLQSETFTALNGLLEKRSQIIESLQQKAVDIESAYDHEKNVLISRIDSLSSRVKELEASSLSQNTQIKALRDNLSREKDRAILAIRQLHCVQEELEEYFSLSSVQSAALDSSLILQNKYTSFLFDFLD